MRNHTNERNKKANALRQVGIARGNLLLMIILTAVNVLLFVAGTDTMLLFSATVPYYVAVFSLLTETSTIITAGLSISAIILLAYLLCWIFSKKHYGWMITALVFFIIDSIAMILFYWWIEDFSGILDVAIHIWVLYYLIVGVIYGKKLADITPEEELEYEASLSANAEPNSVSRASTPLRPVDNDVKARILIEGEYLGHYIGYRRVKRINELVIDGYVYDDVEMLVETVHKLSAAIDGHTVEVGLDGRCSYILIDGQKVAKKIRWY